MDDNIIQSISNNMNLKITDCKEISYWVNGGTGCREDYVNKSYICGNEIILGIYDSEENRLISFFHELGHIASHKLWVESEYENEKMAWEIGFMIAASHGVFFSEEAEDFANEQLKTYNNGEVVELVDTLDLVLQKEQLKSSGQ